MFAIRNAPARRREAVSAAEEAHAAARLEALRGRPAIRPTPTAARHAAAILKPLLDKGAMGLGEIKRRWSEIVGEPIARATAPEKLTRGVLTVAVAGAAAPFIQHQAPLILERCRLSGAAVTKIAIRQGLAPAPPAPTMRPAPRALTAGEEAAMAAALDGIEASPLKAALARLAKALAHG